MDAYPFERLRSFVSRINEECRKGSNSQIFQTLNDPAPLRLCRAWSGRERSRRLWSISIEEIREARGRHPELRIDAVLPLILHSLAVDAADVDLGDATGDAVEACGEYDHIHVMDLAVFRLEAFWHDFSDVALLQANQFHVVLIEALEVVDFERDPLGAKRIWLLLWCQDVLVAL